MSELPGMTWGSIVFFNSLAEFYVIVYLVTAAKSRWAQLPANYNEK